VGAHLPEAHHFIGTGLISGALSAGAPNPASLLPAGSAMVRECGLTVVAESSANFEGGGATLVWILAESHLVIHLWAAEGFATIDLHVCDLRASNAGPARGLKDRLSEWCFAGGSGTWREIATPYPEAAVCQP
jgi:hypothetical protein